MRALIWISFGLEALALTWIFCWNQWNTCAKILKSLVFLHWALGRHWRWPSVVLSTCPILWVWNASAVHRSELNGVSVRKSCFWGKSCPRAMPVLLWAAQLLALTWGISALACGRAIHSLSVCQQKCCDNMKLCALGCELSRTCLNSTMLCGSRQFYFTTAEKKDFKRNFFIVNEISRDFLSEKN